MALASHLSELVQAFSELIAQHLKLAQAELRDDAKVVGAQVAKVAIFAPLILLGYALLNVALALWLRRHLPVEAAFGVVGGVNLLGGALGVWAGLRQLSKAEPLSLSRRQLDESAKVVRPAPPAPQLTEGRAP